MLISSAIRTRTPAVGVGFLLNSSSSVDSWSCVALCLFWFFCCCVKVLFRGGRRDDPDPLVEAGVEGDGVCELLPPTELGEGRPLDMEPGASGSGGASEAGLSALISTLTSVAISGDGGRRVDRCFWMAGERVRNPASTLKCALCQLLAVDGASQIEREQVETVEWGGVLSVQQDRRAKESGPGVE